MFFLSFWPNPFWRLSLGDLDQWTSHHVMRTYGSGNGGKLLPKFQLHRENDETMRSRGTRFSDKATWSWLWPKALLKLPAPGHLRIFHLWTCPFLLQSRSNSSHHRHYTVARSFFLKLASNTGSMVKKILENPFHLGIQYTVFMLHPSQSHYPFLLEEPFLILATTLLRRQALPTGLPQVYTQHPDWVFSSAVHKHISDLAKNGGKKISQQKTPNSVGKWELNVSNTSNNSYGPKKR